MKRLSRSWVLVCLGGAALGCPSDDVTGASGEAGTDGIDSISSSTSVSGGTDSTTAVTSSGSGSSTTVDPPTGSGVTSSPTSGEPTTDPTTMQGSSSSSGGGVCETVVCGPSDTCCGDGEECVLDACLEACASGVRCGVAQDTCCGDGQVCVNDQCFDPNGACVDSFDCEQGEFCEPTLQECLPQFDPVSCEVVPDFNDLSVTEEWSYIGQEVISIPVVADIDGDDVPEVILNLTQIGALSWPGGEILVLDGQTGVQELSLPDNPMGGTYGSHGRSTIGLTDVSGDGLPDIIYAGRDSGGSLILAVDGLGNLLWTSHDAGGADVRLNVVNGAPSFGNFDADPESEIVFGATLIDDDGTVVWDAGNGATFGTNGTYTGGISSIVDLTGDGYPEIVSGQEAWSVDWQEMGGMPTAVTVTELWNAGTPDGYPAIADVDVDGDPEVIIIGSGSLRILNGATGELWCGVDPTDAMCVATPALRTQPVSIPSGGIGGPPTVADFDGDGRPEVATAGAGSYTVYDLYRAGESVVVATGFPNPALGEIYPRWSQPTQDQSSNATGSSVFDFQGDGAAEVVYADECYMRVYDGSDGTVLLEVESSSATIHEYPLVVDVDDDGNSEILVVANDSHSSCAGIAGYTERRGVYVYGDTFDQWVGTRRVWTSHTYHVSNATSAGNAPAAELDNWSQPGLNNYRQNAQGAGVFNAADLTVDLNAELGACTENALEIVATVRNQGALGVPAGISVSLFEGADAMGVLIGTQATPAPLLPGGTTQLTWTLPFAQGDPPIDLYVVVDGVDAMSGTIAECEEDNNDDALVDAECFFPG